MNREPPSSLLDPAGPPPRGSVNGSKCNGHSLPVERGEHARVVEKSAEDARPAANVPDRELLNTFLLARDERAFLQIVERHGPLVLGVALRVLHDRQLAEDVFQATFLVLARKAGTIRRGHSVASWLHGVARRIALRLLRKRSRGREENLHVEPTMEASPLETIGALWEQQVLDEELQQLPESWREPLILHELEGLSCEQTAERLGVTVTALEGRLKRGRRELKHRLLRRGIGVGAVLAAAQSSCAASAATPGAALIAATVHTSLHASSAPSPADPLSSPHQLATEEVAAMSAIKTSSLVSVGGTILLAAGLAGGMAGSSWIRQSRAESGSRGPRVTASRIDTETTIAAADDAEPAISGVEESGLDAPDEFWISGFDFLFPQTRDAVLLRAEVNREFERMVGQQDEQARRMELIRRVTLDLTGMPPTAEDVAEFVADKQPTNEALRDVVDRLISSEAFLKQLQADAGVMDYHTMNPAGRLTENSRREKQLQANAGVMDYHTMNPNEQRIAEALTKRVDLEFIDTELSQVIDFLAERFEIPILPNEAALAELGVGLDTPINLILSGVSLESALNRILMYHELDYVVRNEVLEVTTREDAEGFLQTRVYNVDQLPADFTSEEVARVIGRTVRPESWGNLPEKQQLPTPSGPAMETLPGCLVITHCQRAHREIAELLTQLSRVPATTAPSADPMTGMVPYTPPSRSP